MSIHLTTSHKTHQMAWMRFRNEDKYCTFITRHILHIYFETFFYNLKYDAQIIGYLFVFRVGFPPNDLQRAFLPTISNEKCNEDGMNVTNTEICTYSHFLQGACGVRLHQFVHFSLNFGKILN